ncbi:hypothetical protein L1987_35199 [Smallanthus sonchifolius]|uniref:Uncharacterized protein n=1 Tax=Smallanthus sonchifolius TaxID=185202 RepID=A0ACB9HVY3_9ASTR|nr:hypothetical protein L1987_35199 [Smallanthus sonchifolius]
MISKLIPPLLSKSSLTTFRSPPSRNPQFPTHRCLHKCHNEIMLLMLETRVHLRKNWSAILIKYWFCSDLYSLHPNNSDKSSMKDYILGVSNPEQCHSEVTIAADRIGVGVHVHFNPFVSWNDKQRCVHSYAVHTDSVWALASTPTFSHMYSGGRDLSLALHDDGIWVAATDSSVHMWHSEGLNPEKKATFSIDGIPGIVQHEILNNKRHVLTKDNVGSVKLWEITRGVVIED